MELKNGMIVICPITINGSVATKGFKKGEEFEVREVKESNRFKYVFYITDNDGDRIFCLLKNCRHINGRNWIIKK